MTALHKPDHPAASLSAQTHGAHWGCARITLDNGKIVMDDVWVSGVAGAKSLRRTLSNISARRSANELTPQEAADPTHKHRKRYMLADEVALHVEACRLRRRSVKHVDKVETTLEFLLYVAGDIPIDEVEAAHLVAMWQVLGKFPLNARTQTRFKGKSIEEILELSKDEPTMPPSAATLDGHHGRLMAFFESLVHGSKKLRSNPLNGLGLRIGAPRAPKAERLFTPEDLQAIFDPASFASWANDPHRWWCPMLAFYSGARVSELGQLRKSDISQKDGVWWVHIQARDQGSIKTPHSDRSFAIAQPLIDAGFLDFLDDMRKVPHPRLFPLLAKPKKRSSGEDNGDGYGTTVSANFGKYLKRLGLEKGRGMHSFRHYLITEMTNGGIPIDVIKSITGHSRLLKEPMEDRGSAFEMYQHGLQLTLTQRAKVALDEFGRGVNLPRYTRGQFDVALADPTQFHP